MPLTKKGTKIRAAMRKFYKKKTGSSEKGEQVFYASINEGKITGAEGSTKRRKRKKKK